MKRLLKISAGVLATVAILFVVTHLAIYCTYRPTCDGIDVSHHNDSIEIAEPISFVIAKATEGDNFVDPDFERYREYARTHGLKFGAYHFMSTRTPARRQFENFKNTVGDDIDIIPVLDVEGHKGMKRLSISQMRHLVNEWSKLCLESYGKLPIIYCNDSYRILYFMGFDNPMWIDSKSHQPLLPCAIHQYTNNDDTLDYNHLLTDLNNILL